MSADSTQLNTLTIALISMLAASYSEKITHSIENCSLIDSNNKFITIN